MHTERFHSLDTVRAFALLSGIILHATMTFMPGMASFGFPADTSQSHSLQTVFYVIHLFRMTLFFVIAGFFSHLLFHKKGRAAFLKDRSKRILAPLIIGWLFFGPMVIGIIFMTMAPPVNMQSIPAMPSGFPLAHLWFLYYLLLFYFAILCLRSIFEKIDTAGKLKTKIDVALKIIVTSYASPFIFAAPIALCLYFTPDWILPGGIPSPDTGLSPKIPATFCFGMAFIFGWLLHRQHQLMLVWQQRWFIHLILSVSFTLLNFWIQQNLSDPIRVTPEIKLAYAASYAFAIWNWVFALIGIALTFFSKENSKIRYLADASYWMYLAHMPLIFSLQLWVLDWPTHWSIKFPFIVVTAFAILLLSYHLLVRNTYIGEILNGRKYSSKQTPSLIENTNQHNTHLVAELVDVRKHYGETLALNGLNLQIFSGELLAFLGPNGAGKSTAISCLLGLQNPDEGSVTLFGESPQAITARYQYGAMLQNVDLPPELHVRELIDLSCSYYPSPMSADEAMQLTNITSIANRSYHKLSGGQKRLVQFAIAICGRPKLLFLDEPTVGMDIQARELLWARLRQMVSEGCSIVLTTHYLEEAEALADRVVVLAQGKLVALGTLDDIRTRVTQTNIRFISQLTAEYISQWEGVISAKLDRDHLHIVASDADQVLRRLSNEDPHFRNLEINRAGLADAFTHITREFI